MQTATNAELPKGGSTNPPITIWLIEDNHTFRNTMARVLNASEGMECSQRFSNAEDALDALTGGAAPEIILLDVELPGQNGITAVSAIKSVVPSTRGVWTRQLWLDAVPVLFVFVCVCGVTSGNKLRRWCGRESPDDGPQGGCPACAGNRHDARAVHPVNA